MRTHGFGICLLEIYSQVETIQSYNSMQFMLILDSIMN